LSLRLRGESLSLRLRRESLSLRQRGKGRESFSNRQGVE
jgi:hypothetical protein